MKYDKNDPATWHLKPKSSDEENQVEKQPNKPDGEKPDNVDDRQAIKNQSSVKPGDYPKDGGGRPDYKK